MNENLAPDQGTESQESLDKGSSTLSLSESLSAAWDAQTKLAAEPPAPSTDTASAPAPAPGAAPVAADPTQQGLTPASAPPADPIPTRLQSSYTPEKWATLAPEAKAIAKQYESDIGRLVDKYGKSAAAWSKVEQTIAPYIPMIQAEGGHPLAAIGSLFETARILRQGTPDQKLALVHDMIQRYQIPMQAGEGGVVSVPKPSADPALLNRLSQLEARDLTGRAEFEHNTRTEVDTEVRTFLSDPANVYVSLQGFQDVMTELIQAGVAKDLADAYQQATWKHAGARDLEIAKITKSNLDKGAQAAATARQASISVAGNSPGTPRLDPSKMSVRETLSAAFDGELS